ncbi:MAG: DEAD/DEAH box helicase, partial [Bacillota bacterium]|nr:DEAD/DEAH box helicase [Bacillota bacterium]
MDTIDNGNNEMDGTVEVDGTDIDIDREDLKFTDFRLSPKVIQALNEMNYTAPTAVQKETILPALEGKDLIVLSKTGSGKTAAFGIPAIQLLSDKKVHKVLILAPTRELAVQVESEISTIAKHMRVKSLVVYGKHSIDVEIEKIKKGLDILVGTPGRVLDHIEQENFDARAFDLVILDEADRMLDMGFIDQVDKI